MRAPASPARHVEEAYEVVDAFDGAATVVLSCEHASNRLPDRWRWPSKDAWVQDTHWAWDPGAAEITRRVAARLRTRAVLSRFSRLLMDPNRELTSPTLIRDVAEGRLVHLNRNLSGDERPRRIQTLYRPYHAAFDRIVEDTPGAMVLSIHTFTPVYAGGPPRPMEIGVLYDTDEPEALALEAALRAAGAKTALNEPYSGAAGLMYAAQTHADAHGRKALELEIRQDLASDPARWDDLADLVVDGLRGAGLLGR